MDYGIDMVDSGVYSSYTVGFEVGIQLVPDRVSDAVTCIVPYTVGYYYIARISNTKQSLHSNLFTSSINFLSFFKFSASPSSALVVDSICIRTFFRPLIWSWKSSRWARFWDKFVRDFRMLAQYKIISWRRSLSSSWWRIRECK